MKGSSYLRHEGYPLKKVIMCPPGTEYFSVDNKAQHNITELADKEKAIAQHAHLIELIEKFGAKVLLIDELNNHPNSVFTQDTAISTPNGYIKLNMGLPSRIGEESWMGAYLNSIKVPQIGSINGMGTVEGGDVILGGKFAFVGISTRTNEEGASQISRLLEDQGFTVRIMKVPTPFLHIGGAMSVVSNDTILCVDKVFPDKFFDNFKTIKIPNDDFISGNVITLGNKHLIANKNNIGAIQKLKEFGFIVWECDLSEFTKGTGGPSCLIMPLVRELITN